MIISLWMVIWKPTKEIIFLNITGKLLIIYFLFCKNLFSSCAFHSHDCGIISLKDTTTRDQFKEKQLKKLGTVFVIYSCQWKKLQKNLFPNLALQKSPFSEFFYQKPQPEDILSAVYAGKFYGILQVY